MSISYFKLIDMDDNAACNPSLCLICFNLKIYYTQKCKNVKRKPRKKASSGSLVVMLDNQEVVG
jgi:hypothetical protein